MDVFAEVLIADLEQIDPPCGANALEHFDPMMNSGEEGVVRLEGDDARTSLGR